MSIYFGSGLNYPEKFQRTIRRVLKMMRKMSKNAFSCSKEKLLRQLCVIYPIKSNE